MKPFNILSIFGAVKRALLVVNNHHGGGIDANWTLDLRQTKGKLIRVVLCNSYHCMNQDGFYDGWIDFEIIIPAENVDKWKVSFGTTADWYKINKYMLKEFLEDVFSDELSNYEITLMQSPKLQACKAWYFNGFLK